MPAQFNREVAQATTTDPIAWPRLGRLRRAWYRLRFTIQEMNYATRRLQELQAPWSVDTQWHKR